MFADDAIEITSAFHITEDVMQINYQQKESHILDSRKNSPIINALVTAKARIHLFKAMQTVHSRQCDIIYSDTGNL